LELDAVLVSPNVALASESGLGSVLQGDPLQVTIAGVASPGWWIATLRAAASLALPEFRVVDEWKSSRPPFIAQDVLEIFD